MSRQALSEYSLHIASWLLACVAAVVISYTLGWVEARLGPSVGDIVQRGGGSWPGSAVTNLRIGVQVSLNLLPTRV